MSVTEYAGVGIECNPPEHYPGMMQYLVFMRNHLFAVFTMKDTCSEMDLSFQTVANKDFGMNIFSLEMKQNCL